MLQLVIVVLCYLNIRLQKKGVKWGYMSKPTLFFSHSSKDKDIILSIKNKLDSATGGVMDIFMSSDGQSIPFGTNWIHKIEEGLKAAKIMFVFVTENSISSGWIYFEAGYAYSKGIQVIPVGIGVDIGSLKAPLNLLQGFNISSEDSLNNFITIVNRTFEYHFSNIFEYSDYLEIIKNYSAEIFNTLDFENVIEKAECIIYGEQTVDGKEVKYDMNKFFNSIVKYLEDNNISFSRNDRYYSERNICVVANGIKIEYRKEVSQESPYRNASNDSARIKFYVSSYNFLKAFTLLKNLLQLFEEKESSYIRLHLQDDYSYTISAEDGSSIVMNHAEFDVDKSHIGGYVCNELGLKFYVFDMNEYGRNQKSDYVASVVFDKVGVHAEDIIRLVGKLYDIGFIYKIC